MNQFAADLENDLSDLKQNMADHSRAADSYFEGVMTQAEALKTNLTLTTLDLQYNSIGDNGAHALSEAHKTNPTLTTLDLWRNSVEDYGARALSAARD